MAITVTQIAERIGARVEGDGSVEITGLGSLGTAGPGQLSHLSSPSYRDLLPDTGASAVILKADDLPHCPTVALVADNPYLAFARASQLFARTTALPAGIDASARLGENCQIHPSASIGPHVTVGSDTVIGAGVRIYANAVIGERCDLADQVVIHANATLYRDVIIGSRSVIHSGAVIGAPGFGFTPDESGRMQEIAQLGGVRIGADVSVGAGSSIDCGAIEDTVIEDGVKIDNQVQIGHNCKIGAHSLLCGCVGIAGSSVLGKHCVLAGGVGVGGDRPVTLCDGVMVTAYTPVTQSIDKPGVYSGTIVFHEHSRWRRNALRFTALDELFKRVARLEKSD